MPWQDSVMTSDDHSEAGWTAGSVLIVDDTPENLTVLARLLRSQGYGVRSVLNGRLALQTAEHEPPDIVLLDVLMPDLDGYEVCRRFKADPRLKAIPVIFISAATDTEVKVKAFTSGGVDFIAKPFEAEEVLARVRTHLALAAVEQELERRLDEKTEELRRTSLYARSLIEASLDPLVTISPEGKITDVNRATEEATGLSRTELFGTDFACAFTEPETAREGYRRVLAEGAVRDYPLTIRHASGGTMDVLHNATLYRDQDGRIAGVFAAARDITEIKRGEASRARLAAIVESSGDAILNKDFRGIITSWNRGAETVYGYTASEAVGRAVSMLVPPGREPEPQELIERIERGEEISQFETVRLRKDGRLIDVALTLSPVRDAHGTLIGTSTIARDITAHRQAEAALHRTNRALKTLTSCNSALVHATDEGQLLAQMCKIIVEIGGYRLAWIGHLAPQRRVVRPVVQLGRRPGVPDAAEPPWSAEQLSNGAVDRAVRTGAPAGVQDTLADPDFAPWREHAARIGYASVLALPLTSGGPVFEVLSIHSAEPHAFDDEAEVHLLAELAEDLGYGITALRTRANHDRNLQRLETSMEATIQAIAATVEMRDPYTAGHQYRVAQLAVAIAREMGMPEADSHGLYLASIVHDLGKIHIPAEILSKPGRLSRIEFELVQSHAEAGFELLKTVDFPWPIAEIVSQHHERLDGSGYPKGLRGDQVLLGARIMAVADVVEAMASHRPYRPALGIDLALAEIRQNSGRIYDADVVAACLMLFEEKRFTFQ